MTLADTIRAAGMMPPRALVPGRWLRFPGIGKGAKNRSGWCRMISETLAIYGDWSSDFRSVWKDDTHRDSVETRRLLRESREREWRFAREQAERQRQAALQAEHILRSAGEGYHPYLQMKGFGHLRGLIQDDDLIIPVRDSRTRKLISLQRIAADGEKRFLPGARVGGGVHRLGNGGKTFLVEGYATGLSVYEAARRLYRNAGVVVCFSARNLETIAADHPHAVIAADHDQSGVGQRIARETGLLFVLPPEFGDFNDLHVQRGLHAVVEILRGH